MKVQITDKLKGDDLLEIRYEMGKNAYIPRLSIRRIYQEKPEVEEKLNI